MGDFQKINAITPSFSNGANALLDEIKSNEALLKELHDLGIQDEEIPYYVPLLANYLDSKKVCEECQGLDACQSESFHMCRSLYISMSGRLSSRLGPCPKAMKEITKNSHFLYRDFDPSWNSLSAKALRNNRNKALFNSLIQIMKKGAMKKWCYVHGDSGTGKSYFLAALTNDLAAKGIEISFIDTNKRFDEMKSYSIKDKARFENMLSSLSQSEVLVLDGFGSEYRSDYVRDMILFPLLSNRSKNHAVTFFTSEFSLDEIEALYSKTRSDAILSHRLVELIHKNIDEEIALTPGIDAYCH